MHSQTRRRIPNALKLLEVTVLASFHSRQPIMCEGDGNVCMPLSQGLS